MKLFKSKWVVPWVSLVVPPYPVSDSRLKNIPQ